MNKMGVSPSNLLVPLPNENNPFHFTINLSMPYSEFKISLTLYQTTNFRLFQTERVCRRQH